MRQLTWTTLLILLAALPMAGCSEDAGDVDSGGVSLVISDFDELPTLVGMEQAAAVGLVSAGEITIESIVQNPGLGSGDLQTVRLSSYEVSYSRADSGTRVPTPLVEGLISTVPVGGQTTFENLPILRFEQLNNPPLSDLLFENGGVDDETGRDVIKLNLRLRFFGETLGGRNIVSAPQYFTVDFIPSF